MQTLSEAEKQKRRDIRAIRYFLLKLGIVICCVYVICFHIFSFDLMSGEDMYPRLRDGDLLITLCLDREVSVGDVITFKKNGGTYAGRVVARGGDIVGMSDEGELYVNGAPQTEEVFYPTYENVAQSGTEGEETDGSVTVECTVPEGSWYVLGDFRTNAVDSRTFGTVSEEELQGRLFLVIRRRSF